MHASSPAPLQHSEGAGLPNGFGYSFPLVTPTSRGSETPLWDWLGEALAVDFANTTRRYGDEERDLLEVPDDLVLWAELQRGRVPLPAAGAVRLGEVRIVRDDVKALLHAAVARRAARGPGGRAGQRPRARDPLVRQLRDGEAVLAPAAAAAPLDELLARVAHSAIELSRARRRGLLRRPELRAVLRAQPRLAALVLARLRHARPGRAPRAAPQGLTLT